MARAQRDAVWRETGIVEKFPADGPPVRWRTAIGGGYAGPAWPTAGSMSRTASSHRTPAIPATRSSAA